MNEEVNLNPFEDEEMKYIKETGVAMLGLFDIIISCLMMILLPLVLYDTIYNPKLGWVTLLNFIFMFTLGIILSIAMGFWKIKTYSQIIDLTNEKKE